MQVASLPASSLVFQAWMDGHGRSLSLSARLSIPSQLLLPVSLAFSSSFLVSCGLGQLSLFSRLFRRILTLEAHLGIHRDYVTAPGCSDVG